MRVMYLSCDNYVPGDSQLFFLGNEREGLVINFYSSKKKDQVDYYDEIKQEY